MASAALSADKIQNLARMAPEYWKEEAAVNGVWLGLLAKAFPGSDDFVLQPEGQGEGSNQRNDILVRKITDFTTGTQDGYLVFEGKKEGSGDNMDKASAQLFEFVKNSKRLNHGQRLWGIVARGPTFRLYSYQNQTPYVLKLPRPNIDPSGKPSRGAPTPDYSLSKESNEAGSVVSVEQFLAYARVHLMTWTL
jgi:hypothetical protein